MNYAWEKLTETAHWFSNGSARRFSANLGRDNYHESADAWIGFYDGLHGRACVYVVDHGIRIGLEGAEIRGESIPILELALVEQMKTMRVLLFEILAKAKPIADAAGFRGENS